MAVFGAERYPVGYLGETFREILECLVRCVGELTRERSRYLGGLVLAVFCRSSQGSLRRATEPLYGLRRSCPDIRRVR